MDISIASTLVVLFSVALFVGVIVLVIYFINLQKQRNDRITEIRDELKNRS